MPEPENVTGSINEDEMNAMEFLRYKALGKDNQPIADARANAVAALNRCTDPYKRVAGRVFKLLTESGRLLPNGDRYVGMLMLLAIEGIIREEFPVDEKKEVGNA